jgi:hypothetical protein
MLPDPDIEKLPPLLVPFPEKENENAVWALAEPADRMIAAATGTIQDRYFLLAAAFGHNPNRRKIAVKNMTLPPSGHAVLNRNPGPALRRPTRVISAKTASRWTEVTGNFARRSGRFFVGEPQGTDANER